MHEKFKYNIFIVVVVLYACQEIYVHDSLDTSENIPVIEGLIRNDQGPHTIRLYYARPFDEANYDPISGALVYVTDEAGTSYFFEETFTGTYVCPSERLIGSPGSRYTLHAEFSDGTIIQSEEQLMPDILNFERIYEKTETREFQIRTIDNDFITKTKVGTATYIVIDNDIPEKRYFRITSKYSVRVYSLSTNIKYKWIETEPGDSAEFMIVSDTLFDCIFIYNNNAIPVPGIIDPGAEQSENERTRISSFIPFDFAVTGDYDTTLERGVTTHLYSITREVYDYYNSVAEQLNAPSRLFDPIPTQLKGNLYCLSDPDQEILGLFEVSSYSMRQDAWLDQGYWCIDTILVDTFLIDTTFLDIFRTIKK